MVGLHMQASQINTFNSFFVILLAPIFTWLWDKLKEKQPSSTSKFAWGIVSAAVGMTILLIPLGNSRTMSVWWIVFSIFILEIGEVILSPSGLSMTTKLSPKIFSAQMMGIWYLGDATGQALNAQLIKLYDNSNPFPYILWSGVGCLLIAVILFIMVPKLDRLLAGKG